MIELPDYPKPRKRPRLIDFGIIQRGAATIRVDRAGNRFAMDFVYPLLNEDQWENMTSLLARAKRQGAKVILPLTKHQGYPGSPVVDGAGQSGSQITLRGFRPGYSARVGYWLTIIDADDNACLHRVVETAVADGAGDMTLEIEPPLHIPFEDGDTVVFSEPFIQGFIDGPSTEWDEQNTRLMEGLIVTVEEYR